MTYIKSLTFKGFKSFARETKIELDKGFSCIVGPNGSGKSNISDGILFVLGKIGSKGLRADKSSSLIYNGGETGKPSSEAVVDLCLDNSEKIFPLDNKEIKVTRIVRRNGISIYKINNETKTRQEVLELLNKAGISHHGFNIVLQHAISRFVEMRNEDKRFLIENIAGISVYEERKKKSLRELEKTQDRLKEISTILNERGKYLVDLEKDRKQALTYKKLKEDVEIFKAALIIKQISNREKEASTFLKKIETERKKLDSIKNEIIGMQKEANSFFNEMENVTKRIEEATGKEQTDLRLGLVEIKSNIASLEARKSNLVDQIKSNLEKEKQLIYDLEQNEKSLIEKKQELKEKPKNIDSKEIGKEIMHDERKLIGNIEGVIEKIRGLRERKVEKQELINFLESVENVCLIIKELVLKIKENRDTLASPQKFVTVQNLEIGRGVLENEIGRMKLVIKRGKEDNKRLHELVKEIDKKLYDTASEERDTEEVAKGFEKKFKGFFDQRSGLEKKYRAKEEEIKKREEIRWQIDSVLRHLEIENARFDEDMKNLKQELQPYEKVLENAKTIKKREEILKEEITSKQQKLEVLGSINLKALEIYDEAKKEYDSIVGKADKLVEEKAEILKIVAEIDKKKKKAFMDTFNKINENFMRIFKKLAIKGIAFLELENKENPFEEGEGIDIKIKIAKGKYLDKRSLSGGEKTMTALAFIFAIQEFKPHHFYLLDEVDADLDKRNSERLAVLLREYVRKAQYISITHNDAMIGAADKLYGISMQNGSSKVISLKLDH
ncbi:MAG: hypothetical protein KJ767_03200 [Nanoarchaeota archaeon]|nr:hypothetical protein [Nanoarchaeota archaeon]